MTEPTSLVCLTNTTNGCHDKVSIPESTTLTTTIDNKVSVSHFHLDKKDINLPFFYCQVPEETSSQECHSAAAMDHAVQELNSTLKEADKITSSEANLQIDMKNNSQTINESSKVKQPKEEKKRSVKGNRELNAILKAAKSDITEEVNGSNGHHSNGNVNGRKREARRSRVTSESGSDDTEPSRGKRLRLQHQPFQVTPSNRDMNKLFKVVQTSTAKKEKEIPTELIVYKKSDFLALRNEEGGFYICRLLQNISRTSRGFKIRWLNEVEKDIYVPDYEDKTEFECILTNLELFQLQKGRYNLPQSERRRVMNILQRALDVELGVTDAPDPKVVAEDGIDVSTLSQTESSQVEDTASEEGSVKLVIEVNVEKKSKKLKKTVEESKVEIPSKKRGRPRKESIDSTTTTTSTSTTVSKKRSSRQASTESEPETPKQAKRKKSVDSTRRKSTDSSTEVSLTEPKSRRSSRDESRKSMPLKRQKSSDVVDGKESSQRNGKEPNKSKKVADKIAVSKLEPKKNATSMKLKQDMDNKLRAKLALEKKEAATSKKSKVEASALEKRRSSRQSPVSEKKEDKATAETIERAPRSRTAAVAAESKSTPFKESTGKPKIKVTPMRGDTFDKKPVDILELIGFEVKSCPTKALPLSLTNKTEKSRLEVAIRCGDDKTAIECIKSGIENTQNLLSLAFLAIVHCPQTLPSFLSHGVDAKSVDQATGNTLLHSLASLTKKTPEVLSIAQLLVSKGADVNAQNHKKKTALHLASAAAVSSSVLNEHDSAFMEFLIDHQARLTARDEDDRIPLYYSFIKSSKPDDSAYCDPIDQVTLLSRKLDLTEVKDHLGQTALHRAAFRGATVSCMHLLRLTNNKDPLDIRGNTPLAFAVLNAHDGCVLALINGGCNFTLKITKPPFEPEVKLSMWSFIHESSTPKTITSSITREVIERNWHRSRIFIMSNLTSFGSSLGFGIDAYLRCRKLKYALRLLSRCTNDDISPVEGSKLIHSLCESTLVDDCLESQKKVLSMLNERKISDASSFDENGSSAIIGAAANLNHILCEDLTNLLGLEKVANLKPNARLLTPLTALLLNIENRDLSKEMKTWGATLVSAGASLNSLAYYPVKLPSFPGIKVASVSHDDLSSHTKLSPLMVAVIHSNYNVVKYLVQQKADLNFPDEEGRTAIMYAVQLNDLKMIQLLLHLRYEPERDSNPWNSRFLTFKQTSNVDLEARDSKGRTVVHYVVRPFDELTFASAPVIIRLLKEVGAPLNAPDYSGVAPLAMARQLGLSSVVDTLIELIPDLPFVEKSRVTMLPTLPVRPMPTEQNDFGAEATRLANDKNMCDPIVSVRSDPLLGFGDSSEIVRDAGGLIPLTTLLIKPRQEDLSSLEFFKLQVVEHKARSIIVLFTRWGVFPEVGDYKKKTCSTKSEAISEFKKVFSEKTGNEWDTVLRTQRVDTVPNKYRVVFIDPETQRSHTQQNEFPFLDQLNSETNMTPLSGNNNIPNHHSIPNESRLLILHLMNSVQNTRHTLNIDPIVLCKKIGISNIQTAQEQIDKMIKLVQDKDNEIKASEGNKTIAAPKVLPLLYCITDLNIQMYQQIPLPDKQLLIPGFEMHNMIEKKQLLDNIHRQLLYKQLLLAVDAKKDTVDPFDFFRCSLAYSINLLEPESLESQLLLRSVSRSCKGMSVKGVFSLESREQIPSKVLNPWLLFSEIPRDDVVASLLGLAIPSTSGPFGQVSINLQLCIKEAL